MQRENCGRVARSFRASRTKPWVPIWPTISALVLALCFPLAAQRSRPTPTFAEVKAILDALPPCTWISGLPIDTSAPDEPYMSEMRQLGVARATVVLEGKVGKEGVEVTGIAGVLFYRVYDGPNPELAFNGPVDAKALLRLRGVLVKAALARAPTLFKQQPTVDGRVGDLTGRSVEAELGFASEGWLPPDRNFWYSARLAAQSPLVSAAGREDLEGVRRLITTARPTPELLGQALMEAAQDRFDNAAVIHELVRAGADPNYRGPIGWSPGWTTTPLIAAAATDATCNAENLLELGADITARDNFGHTALDWAARGGNSQLIRAFNAAKPTRIHP